MHQLYPPTLITSTGWTNIQAEIPLAPAMVKLTGVGNDFVVEVCAGKDTITTRRFNVRAQSFQIEGAPNRSWSDGVEIESGFKATKESSDRKGGNTTQYHG